MPDLLVTSTAAAMAAIVATWLVIALALVALGALAFPVAFSSDAGSAASPAPAGHRAQLDPVLQLLFWFWTGWSILIALLQLWHLALPIDDRALLAAACLAVASLLLRRRQLNFALASLRMSPLTLALSAALTLLVANVAASQITNYDTGLYHLQAVQWNCDYAIVPGLANLHGRLGFNNASFLYNALLDAGPWNGRSHHIASGVLLLSVLLASVASLSHLLRNRATALSTDAASRSRLARAMLFAPALLTNYNNITSCSPDLPATLFGIVMAMLFVEIAVRHRAGTAQPKLLAPIVLLASISIAVKLSMLPYALTVVALAWFWLRRPVTVLQSNKASIAASLAVALAVLAPWTIRGYILSGYPAFPATVLPLTILQTDVDWLVPRQRAIDEAAMIVNWARTRSIEPGRPGLAWIPSWAAQQAKDFLKVDLPLAIALGCGVIALLRRRAMSVLPKPPRCYSLLAIASVAHLAFLLCTAPDLSRFAGASLWLLAIFATLAWLDAEDRSRRFLSPMEDTASGRRILSPTHAPQDAASRTSPNLAQRLTLLTTAVLAAVALAKVAALEHLTGPGGLAPIPQPRLVARQTLSGATIFVPTDSDQAWAAPLPSTPWANPALELRDPNDLAAGFRIRQ